MKKLILIIVALTPLLEACNKGNLGGGEIGFRRRMLVAHNWRMTKIRINGETVSLPDCERDNVYNFNDNENGYMDEGGSKCDSATSVLITGAPQPSTEDGGVLQRINFQWSVTGDQRYIYIKNFGSTDYNPEWLIYDMNENQLIVQGKDIRDGYNYSYEKTFVIAQ